MDLPGFYVVRTTNLIGPFLVEVGQVGYKHQLLPRGAAKNDFLPGGIGDPGGKGSRKGQILVLAAPGGSKKQDQEVKDSGKHGVMTKLIGQ
jgi:hypothetical protein